MKNVKKKIERGYICQIIWSRMTILFRKKNSLSHHRYHKTSYILSQIIRPGLGNLLLEL